MPLNQVTVINPGTTNMPDTTTLTAPAGRQGDQLVSEIHGKYYTENYRGQVFTFTQAAITLPVNAATLASKFSVYNPPGSGKNLELISCDAAYVVATTVVNAMGLYYSTAASGAAGSTFTTSVVPIANLLGGNAASVAIAYSALTAVGTPVLAAIMFYSGAVTSTAFNTLHYDFDGRIIVTPGTLIHVANTTAAGTAAGTTLGLTWAEVPV